MRPYVALVGFQVKSGFVCVMTIMGVLLALLPTSAEGDPIDDHNGDAAGELDVLCPVSGSGIDCLQNEDVIIRYSASAGRDLEIRDDQSCSGCLNGPPFFMSPISERYECTGITYPHLIPSGEIFEVSAVEDCSVPLPLEPGTWTYSSDVLGFSQPVLAFFDVHFFVLPESPLGAAALLGSSLAVLGGFLYLRQYKITRQF